MLGMLSEATVATRPTADQRSSEKQSKQQSTPRSIPHHRQRAKSTNSSQPKTKSPSTTLATRTSTTPVSDSLGQLDHVPGKQKEQTSPSAAKPITSRPSPGSKRTYVSGSRQDGDEDGESYLSESSSSSSSSSHAEDNGTPRASARSNTRSPNKSNSKPAAFTSVLELAMTTSKYTLNSLKRKSPLQANKPLPGKRSKGNDSNQTMPPRNPAKTMDSDSSSSSSASSSADSADSDSSLEEGTPSHQHGSTINDADQEWLVDETTGWDAQRDLLDGHRGYEARFYNNGTGRKPLSKSVIQFTMATIKEETSRMIQTRVVSSFSTTPRQQQQSMMITWRNEFDTIIDQVHDRLRTEGLPNVYIRSETPFDSAESLDAATAREQLNTEQQLDQIKALKPQLREWERKAFACDEMTVQLQQELDDLLERGRSQCHVKLTRLLQRRNKEEEQTRVESKDINETMLFKSAPKQRMDQFMNGLMEHCERRVAGMPSEHNHS